MKALSTLLLLGCLWPLSTRAQLPTDSFAVTRECGAAANVGSQLQSINVGGSLSQLGDVRVVNPDNSTTPVIVNALGYDEDNTNVLYGLSVPAQVTSTNFTTPPTLYRIDLGRTTPANAGMATNLGSVTPPPAPSGGNFINPGFRIVLNFIGDGETDDDAESLYYIGGVSFLYNYSSNKITKFSFYVGTIQLNQPGTFNPAPAWRELDISDQLTTTVIDGYKAQIEAYLAGGATGPAPDGGIQDWVYDPVSGSLVSYLGQQDRFLTIANLATAPVATAPVATTIEVAAPIPTSENVGAMFRDNLNQLYTVDAENGVIHQIDITNGNYSDQSYGAAFGCSRGDAMSFAGALPLPVTLTGFAARLQGSQVLLTWNTAQESAADFFAVERSPDGQHWQRVHRQPATNTAQPHQYQFTDRTPAAGRNYYRLLMQDLDGTRTYSEARTVSQPLQPGKLSVYPIPSAGLLNVSFEGTPTAPLVLLNTLGQIVRQISTPTAAVQLSTAGLPGGVYFLRTQIGGQLVRQQVLVP